MLNAGANEINSVAGLKVALTEYSSNRRSKQSPNWSFKKSSWGLVCGGRVGVRGFRDEAGVALVYLVNVLPSLTMKLSGPYWFHYVSYKPLGGDTTGDPGSHPLLLLNVLLSAS